MVMSNNLEPIEKIKPSVLLFVGLILHGIASLLQGLF